ncbi:MAG: 23S rRNA (pseudouridine(1915)-N(3))-methyltransferase RlmH [Oscillospiraceae bacterium]|nr:23S rRNA (pseudouridine(1915)-N(3))-methyltransferase RlmH [Oscillospiraceae bacterium]
MFTITVISVGRLKDRFYEDAAAEYLKRLSAYAKVNIIEIKAADLPDAPGQALINSALQKEGREIIKKIPADAVAVSLCVEGKLYSSEELAGLIENSAGSGISHIAFIIGGSYGLSEEVKSKTKIRLSMSKMTFPHRLARIMLLEQIYRAFKISKGEKYHK